MGVGEVPVVDCWIGFPTGEPLAMLEPLRAQFKDAESRAAPSAPVDYLFGPDGKPTERRDAVAVTLEQMDRHDIALGVVLMADAAAERAVTQRPDRFKGLLPVDPNQIVDSVRAIAAAAARPEICGVYTFPCGDNPQVPVDDARHYPIYAACVEHDLAIVVNAGIVGPRVPSAAQQVARFDEVCYDFPELRIVMCHGAEPDADLAVKLMLKWPGLHFMTSGFAPRHYPREIIDYANSRGADKVFYAGYYPFGLSLERIFAELAALPLRDHVWPKFLRDNARRVFSI